jgi:hypothetical protein
LSLFVVRSWVLGSDVAFFIYPLLIILVSNCRTLPYSLLLAKVHFFSFAQSDTRTHLDLVLSSPQTILPFRHETIEIETCPVRPFMSSSARHCQIQKLVVRMRLSGLRRNSFSGTRILILRQPCALCVLKANS